jgi:hypothetical protein
MKKLSAINYLVAIVLIGLASACSKRAGIMPPEPTGTTTTTSSGNLATAITVDCGQAQGNVMRLEQANVHSTTSDLPGEKTRTWLQALNHKTIRTWLALRTINKEGYNYKYDGNATSENSLAYYSTCADSLLIALTASTPSASLPLPGNGKGAAFQNFIKQTIIYYKNKYPKIKYIQAGNEPDYNGEAVADYYEVYKDYYKAVNAANIEMGLTGNSRIMLSNGAFTSTTTFSDLLTYTNQFLSLYAADADPGKRLDFFSMNCYTEQTARQVFVTEYGLAGGNFIPTAWNQAQVMTAWAPAQIAKAFYLYEGGVDRVFNWCISHADILHKSELADIGNAYPNPYGYALVFGKEVSARGTRVKATSTKLSAQGLGINALAAMGNNKGIAILVWNYNYTTFVGDQEINVQVNNIPQSAFNSKVNAKVYMLDSKNNNIFSNPTQTSLKSSTDQAYNYASTLNIPLKLEANSVALILLNP